MDIDPGVALRRDHRLTAVKAHPDARLLPIGPGVLGEGSLGADRGRDGVGSGAEGGEDGVALEPDLVPPVAAEGVPQQRADATPRISA